jgi:hypothetical protein
VLEEAKYSVAIQAWDFRVGGNFVLNMQKHETLPHLRKSLAIIVDPAITFQLEKQIQAEEAQLASLAHELETIEAALAG